MPLDRDISHIQETVAWVANREKGLAIVGNGSKSKFFNPNQGDVLQTADLVGIVDYQPDELVVCVMAGTPISDLEQVLTENGQMLAADPPQFQGRGTVGGAVACGFSGPARPWRGSLKDAVLGLEVINGLGERLVFGGRVMKNVAGFDVSRLHCGACGTLGVITQVNLRVQPLPVSERTFEFDLNWNDAWSICCQLLTHPIPISAFSYQDDLLRLRLSGSDSTIQDGLKLLPACSEIDGSYWSDLRDHSLAFFFESAALTRVWQARGVEPKFFEDNSSVVEWAGGQIWYESEPTSELPLQNGGSSVRVGGASVKTESKYTKRLRNAFDPKGVFNRDLRV